MASDNSFWFHVGYALEGARRRSAPTRTKRSGLSTRASEEPPANGSEEEVRWPSADDLVASGVAALVGGMLQRRLGRSHARISQLVRAGAAGAGAALLLDLVRPLLNARPAPPTLDRKTADRMLAGVGQGLLYGAVVEPSVPGPPLVKGALFGSAEFATDAAGGLSRLLRAHTPQGRLPVVGEVLESIDPDDRVYLEHLVFGIALALLYGSSRSSNGTLSEEEDQEGLESLTPT